MTKESPYIILIAPNVSEQMGGEAIKALQIFQEFKKIYPNTIQITHERNERELSGRLNLEGVHYIRDTWVSVTLWRTKMLGFVVGLWFCKKAVRLAEQIAEEKGYPRGATVIHQTEPNSPVMPRFISKKHVNVFGPINGNIYYPKLFRDHEKLTARLRRVLHFPFQRLNRLFFRNLSRADLIFTAGGERTYKSLLAGGCKPQILMDTVDCGIRDTMLDRPRIVHQGVNERFVHFGRLVFHKCTFLIIQSLAKTKYPITLDIIGAGPELERCKQLTRDLNLTERVRFLGWFKSHNDLLDSLGQYRGVVLPSIEDANGIVIQESMALGLPAICLDWGGPQLLVDHAKTGYLIEPTNVEQITDKMAEYLDTLSQDGAMAESMSLRSRAAASEWRWSEVAAKWAEVLVGLIGNPPNSSKR